MNADVSFRYGQVLQAAPDPVVVRLDGDLQPLDFSPVTLAVIGVGDRVLLAIYGTQAVILGRVRHASDSAARGLIAYGKATTSSAGSTGSSTIVDFVESAPFYAEEGRIYKVTIQANVLSTVNGDTPTMVIREGTTSLRASWGVPVGPSDRTLQLSELFTFTEGVHTLKGAVYRGQGTGTVSVYASSTEEALIFVEDAGLA